jgi:glycosyltransferase involved in cell wall biosynthesis
MKNDVTVVIPTRNRPQFVVRAVASALSQTYKVKEVIVVVDGQDEVTVSALAAFDEPRLRTIVLPTSSGSNNARNHGAACALSEWIAFLDDDDEWLPRKLETQLASAESADIVSCRFFSQSSGGVLIWPKHLPEVGEKFGDYLFNRRSVFNGEAAIITSTLLVRKAVFDQMPFSTTLRRHQDTDWVIRSIERGARFAYAPEPLLQFNDDIGRVRISTSYDWRQSLDWIRSVRGLLGPRAYAGFVLTSVGSAASDKRDWIAFPLLLSDAIAKGQPTALHLALYLGMWLFPQRTRQQARSLLTGRPRQKAR